MLPVLLPVPSNSVTVMFPADQYARPCAFMVNLYIQFGQTPVTFYGTAEFDANGNYKCTGASFYLWSDGKVFVQGAPFSLPISTGNDHRGKVTIV